MFVGGILLVEHLILRASSDGPEGNPIAAHSEVTDATARAHTTAVAYGQCLSAPPAIHAFTYSHKHVTPCWLACHFEPTKPDKTVESYLLSDWRPLALSAS